MQLDYDIWLLLISALAGTVAVLVAFNLVARIFTSSIALKKVLLPSFALLAGTALWANHLLISYAFHHESQRSGSTALTFTIWVLAIVIGFIVLNDASKRDFKISTLLGNSAIAGLCTFGMFYCDMACIYSTSGLLFDNFAVPFTLLFTTGVITAIAMLFFWIKSYNGRYQILVRLFTAHIIALSIIAIHFAFYHAIMPSTELNYDGNAYINAKLMGIIVALSFVSVFLLLFVVILFAEKYSHQLFKFSFFDANKNAALLTQQVLDSLTKLPNRKSFQQHLESAAKRSDRAGTTFALAYIDLDHFKPINDQYGHHVGDAVLTTIAHRLNTAMRGCDFLARIGGDEFVAIFEEIKSDDDISPIADRIIKSIRESFTVLTVPIEISCSMGIAIYPKDGDLDNLIVCADAAMYKAKEGGKNQFRFFDTEIESTSKQTILMQRELRNAIGNNEFFLALQPKVDCETQSPIGAEALIRWRHPSKGIILPDGFLPDAKRFGLINQINDWVLEECCRIIYRAKKTGIDLNLSINLANEQFRNPNLVEEIKLLLKKYKLAAHNLTFEIKEATAIKNQAQFKLLLSKFKKAQIKVALDDFGSHPISLTYLQDLQVDEVKLDKVFVHDIDSNTGTKALIDAVIRLAHALNLSVVAEGVETEKERETLVSLGCNHMQG
ncbi:MAG: EAL domain-containing protein, partial [Methylophilaceae bacterium]